MKTLIYDIETSYNQVKAWSSGYNLTITHHDIIKERAIICISYKWAGQKKINHLIWDKYQNDKYLISEFAKILKEADEIVAHNGDQFDLKWIRGRAIKHGIDLPYDIISIDTLKLARRYFRFNSNKLDYIAKYLEVGGKVDTGGLELWDKVILKNDKKALKKMVRYCDNDVAILEKVYNKFKPYVPAKLSITDNRIDCSQCGGQMNIAKRRTLASGAKQTQLQCQDCGRYKTVPTSIYEKNN